MQVVDVLVDGEAMRRLGTGCTKIFFDINGTRELDTVLTLLTAIQKHVQPELIIIKSQQLYDSLVPKGSNSRR